MYMAWGSPASVAMAAENDLRPLVDARRSEWQVHVDEMERVQPHPHGRRSASVPPSPVVLLAVYVARGSGGRRATRAPPHGAREYADSARRHYQLANPEHLPDVKGYEYYNELAAKVTAEGTLGFRAAHLERQVSGDRADVGELRSYLTDSHVWGTPDAVYAEIRERMQGIGCEEFVGVFKCGDMSFDVATESMNLFARTVLPRLQELPIAAPPTASSV